MADAKQSKPGSSFVLLLSFMAVAFVLFDPTLRDFLSRGVGFVFNPLFGFGGRFPLWTVILAGVTMILASTVIRHFLVDWIRMARTQEVMRHFQKEFRDAQKSNNTYKIKRLTEAQPEIMKLQADMSGDQLKPMALTMVVVVPIFLWLSTFMAAPVHYAAELDAEAPAVVLAYGDDLFDADVVARGSPATIEVARPTHFHVYQASAASVVGNVHLGGETGTLSFPADAAEPLPEGRVVNLTAGEHKVRTVDNLDIWNTEEPAKLNRAILAVEDAEGVVRRVVVVGPEERTFVLDEDARVRIIVPAAVNAAPRGNPLQVHLDGERHDFGADDVTLLPTAEGEATVTPKGVKVPWNHDWDLLTNWKFLPRWIILYTVVSIPLGTVTQRLLKKWEFKHLDLDADGVPAGKSL